MTLYAENVYSRGVDVRQVPFNDGERFLVGISDRNWSVLSQAGRDVIEGVLEAAARAKGLTVDATILGRQENPDRRVDGLAYDSQPTHLHFIALDVMQGSATAAFVHDELYKLFRKHGGNGFGISVYRAQPGSYQPGNGIASSTTRVDSDNPVLIDGADQREGASSSSSLIPGVPNIALYVAGGVLAVGGVYYFARKG